MSPTLQFSAKAMASSSRDIVQGAEMTKTPKNVLDSTQSFNMATQTAREHIIIAILIAVISLSVIGLILFLIHRRFVRRVCHKKKLDIEEGWKEVTEARAFRPQDETLKEGYFTTFAALDGSIYVDKPLLKTPPTSSQLVPAPAVMLTRLSVESLDSIDSHPLFHPGIKRSRTIPVQTPQYSNGLSTGSITHPKIVDNQPASLKSQTSTISLGSYYRTESKPMTPFSTMQTRRPETPPAILEKLSYRSAPPPPLNRRRQIHSFWSESDTVSSAPTSPSLYSPTCPRPLSPRPASNTVEPGQMFNEDPFGTSNAKPLGTPIRPIFSIDREGSLPELSYPLPLLIRKSSTTLGQLVLPLSVSAPPRMISPVEPCALSPLCETDEAPSRKIQRWLSVSESTGTASFVESENGQKRRSSEPHIYRTEQFPRRARIAPIRSMRSSRVCSYTGEEIKIGAAL
ncbi:hypothetical protein VTL71DRAFT_10149 [Oculimacula yallundae]|uniref:Uncharacterized protein n=1 Tax=Oculimacula yallundae TaxID=86028 RepID=A0ABR4BPR2_9HELO